MYFVPMTRNTASNHQTDHHQPTLADRLLASRSEYSLPALIVTAPHIFFHPNIFLSNLLCADCIIETVLPNLHSSVAN